jgi:hypothetical protein
MIYSSGLTIIMLGNILSYGKLVYLNCDLGNYNRQPPAERASSIACR